MRKKRDGDALVHRAQFRAAADHSEALALDPGGAGIIARAIRGRAPQPGAFGLMFDVPPALEFDAEAVRDGIAVLRLEGPIQHHSAWYWASYEDLAGQIECALAHGDVKAVVLKIDSPGGVAAGMGEAHARIRSLQERYGKPVYAYVDETACSAAYHVASACAEIWLPAAARVGSVGVILCTIDESASLEQAGIKVRYVVSGARKADLHPGQPVTEEVLDVAQDQVDYLAKLFFEAVAAARGLSPEKVKSYQAAVFHGPEAIGASLADGLASWEDFLGIVKRATSDPGSQLNQVGARATIRSTRATRPEGAAAPSSRGRKMAKLLKLQAALDAARTKAKAAVAALTQNPKSKALAEAAEKALREKIAAADALAAEKAKTTRVTEKYSEKKERVESTDDDEPPAEEEEEEAEGEEESDSDTDMPEDDSEEEAEGEEEEKALDAAAAAAWDRAEAAYQAAIKGDPALAIRSPLRLLREGRKATGHASISGIFGALSGFRETAKAQSALAEKVARLEKSDRAQRVDRLIAAAKAEGKIVGKQHADDMRAQGMAQGSGWLKARIEAMPKIARTTAEGGFVPRAGTEGELIGGMGSASSEEEKILAQMTAGMDAKSAAEFRSAYAERIAKSSTNRKIPRS